MESEICIKGSGSPRVVIVGGLHGDEPIGRKIIERLKKLSVTKGTLVLVVAHPLAEKKKKRFLKEDLNRVFPGNSKGSIERRIAFRLLSEIRKADLVLDIHATNSQIDSLIITTRLTSGMRKTLSFVPIKKVALIKRNVFAKGALINYCNGISIEYGHEKSHVDSKKVFSHVKTFLKNAGVMSGKIRLSKSKVLYEVFGVYKVPIHFRQSVKLTDFKVVEKGEKIGHVGKRAIYSRENFYPIFLGRGRYEGILALMAIKKIFRSK